MDLDQDFADFVATCWASLNRLAYLLTASPTDAEDLVQTALEKAYVRWDRISQMDYAEAYVRRMLVTSMLSGRRRFWHRERPTDHLPDGTGESIELGVVDHSLLWPLVCALPDRQRAVIVLRFYEDMSEAQVADTLGCAPGTVKSQTAAAKAALRRALAASGIGETVGEP